MKMGEKNGKYVQYTFMVKFHSVQGLSRLAITYSSTNTNFSQKPIFRVLSQTKQFITNFNMSDPVDSRFISRVDMRPERSYKYLLVTRQSRGSSIRIATGYRLDDRGVGAWVLVGSRILCSPHHPDQLWPT
jgi:hypothetical protein